MTVKEVANKIAIEVITQVANHELTGEEKETKVCEFLAKLDDALPVANFIPNALEIEILEIGVDKVQAYLHSIDIKAFVKKNYTRIKSLLNKLFHKK